MRKIYRFIAAAAAGALLLSGAACSKAKQGEYPVKIAGHEVTAEPQKVVCLSDNIADILIACGYTDAIVAKTDECDQPELDGVPSVGSRNNPSYSRIESLSPDVVFADKSVSADLVKKLDDNSINVFNMIKAQNGKEMVTGTAGGTRLRQPSDDFKLGN